MNRDQRHRVLQHLFWSWLGLRSVRLVQAAVRRWEYVILNRSLHSATNGEHWLISQLPQDQPFVVDVGFNTGEFAREVLRQRPSSRVLGFDPARQMQSAFVQSFSENRRVTLEPIALSNHPGRATFYDSDSMSSSLAPGRTSLSGSQNTYEVEVETLDRYAQTHSLPSIDLLKIDAEGYDLNVLEGADRLLRNQQVDLFLFEYADGWINNHRFLCEAAHLAGRHPYRLFRLFNGFLAPFRYTPSFERFDLGCMFVGVSERFLAHRQLPVRNFPI